MSEIVVPCFDPEPNFGNRLMSVLDIDSPEVGTFDGVDQAWLEKMLGLVYG